MDKTTVECVAIINGIENNEVIEKKVESFGKAQLDVLRELVPWITMGTVSKDVYGYVMPTAYRDGAGDFSALPMMLRGTVSGREKRDTFQKIQN